MPAAAATNAQNEIPAAHAADVNVVEVMGSIDSPETDVANALGIPSDGKRAPQRWRRHT
jgi:hypothetical protein